MRGEKMAVLYQLQLDQREVDCGMSYVVQLASGHFFLVDGGYFTPGEADRLYGVTMPEHGISKVLMLNINDISKKKGEDWDGIFG